MSLETNQNDLVIVALSATKGSDDVSLLHSYKGVRVYDRRHVDPRVTMGEPIPHFRSWNECEAYLHAEPGKTRPCLLDYEVAKRVFNVPFADHTPDGIGTHEKREALRQRITDASENDKGVRLSAEDVSFLVEWI